MLDHWKGHTVDFLAKHLPLAKRQIRVATGFFTVQGYNLIRRFVIGKTVQVMVGYDETSHERLKQKLIDDIMLHLSRWDEANRREAVLDLVAKFQRGEFNLVEQDISELIDARIRERDHAKVYIIDESMVLSGSANLTANGLLSNTENLAAVNVPERVAYWCEQFEIYWNAPDTQDLTQALLDALLKWLELSFPYDIYLKTIQALVPEDETKVPRDTYKLPVPYQRVVIERTLRQLKEFRGSMIVASTGLGKTVMATHTAFRLYREQKILNVLVFAPLQVHKEWKKSFRDAGIPAEVLTRNLLDQPIRGRGKTSELEEYLRECDDKTLIILDETQYFVNKLRASGDGDRRSFDRIVEIVHPRQAYVLLLTATPMVKASEDLNNQLFLLPHTAPSTITNSDGQLFLIPPDKKMEGHYPWVVRTEERFFEEFMNLPVVTVISTSYVAKTFATNTDQGDYLEFGASRRWIPQIELRKITVPVPLEKQMTTSLQGGYFKHKMQTFRSRGGWMRSETNIQKEALIAWASSPKALAEIVTGTIEDTYQVDFLKRSSDRRRVLTPLLKTLTDFPYEQDAKLLALCQTLDEARQQGRKCIVFSERLATCMYLEDGLLSLMPELKIANAVQCVGSEYELKDAEAVHELILDFAPEANSERIPAGHRGKQYDVFITTDAYGVGVNLQDASVVISYDIAWTPDTIIQRAGRILRFWKEPRKVYLYIFVGAYREFQDGRSASIDVEARMRRLTERTRQAERFTEIPMIPDEEWVEFPSLAQLSNVSMETLGMLEVSDISSHPTPTNHRDER
jgi:hypothetical protein